VTEEEIRAGKQSETNRGRNRDTNREIRDNGERERGKREKSEKQKERKRYGRSACARAGKEPNEIKHRGGSLLLYRAVNEK